MELQFAKSIEQRNTKNIRGFEKTVMKLIELRIRNFGCIDEKGITVKIDNIVVLIGPNNVGKTTVLKAL